MFEGTVITPSLNIRPTAASTQPAVGGLIKDDKVQASIVVNGWWKLSKITRSGSNVLLPAVDCYAYQGDSNGYIRLDSATPIPTPDPTAVDHIIDDNIRYVDKDGKVQIQHMIPDGPPVPE